MATETTYNNKRDDVLIEPRPNQMRERLGFERPGMRREFAAVESLDLTDKHIESEDRTFIDPATVDLPFGPTEMGEQSGSGIRLYTEDGDRWQTYRFAHGFSVQSEDLDASDDSLARQRDEVMNIFDFYADVLALTGLEDDQGNTLKKGILQYMKDNVPSNRTFDLTEYTDEESDDPENILFEHALAEVSGNTLNLGDSMRWDTLVCTQSAFSKFNQIKDTSAGADRATYWQRINSEDAVGGVNDFLIVPPKLTYPTPEGRDPIEIDLTQYMGDDEAVLLPDMETAATRYWKLYEMDSPEGFPLNQKDGGRFRQDYAWRYNHVFNPKGSSRWADLEDTIHIQNLSELFV